MLQASTSVARVPRSAVSPRIRVLIVDDSIVARAVLSRMLEADPGVEVVATADTAASAHRVLAERQVDIILLDLELPGLHGLDALPGLLDSGRGARVLIVSSACDERAEASVTALRLGAADTLLKPGAAHFNGRFAEELVDKLRRIARPGEEEASHSGAGRAHGIAAACQVQCVGIGSSTGGVPALARFFGALPASFTSPVLVTQHLPAPFMQYFASQLQDMSGRPTRLGAPGLQPQPGEILLAPGDAHMTLARTGKLIHVRLERGKVVSGCRPSVDPMLASLARIYGPAAVGVMLSGMGRDGVVGAAALAEAGGRLLAQDEETSVVWGMPGAVAGAGLAQAVLPPEQIASRIVAWSEGDTAWK